MKTAKNSEEDVEESSAKRKTLEVDGDGVNGKGSEVESDPSELTSLRKKQKSS